MERNKAEAELLKRRAEEKLAENERIETEMKKVLAQETVAEPSGLPPSSKFVAAYKNGHALSKLALEHGATDKPPSASVGPPISSVPLSKRAMAEREVVYAAVAIVRSWIRRKKARYHNQERELMNAVERLTWEP